MTQVLGHLLVQRGLQDRLRELLEQPARAGQRQALLPGAATGSSASFCSAFPKARRARGYVSYFNEAGQTVNPFTGQTIARSDPFWHWEWGRDDAPGS